MKKPMEIFRENYEHRDLTARKWRARGRKVIGYMCNAVPEEMIMAAGALPVRLAGTPGAPIDTMVGYVGSTAYSEGFMATMLNGLVTGKYDYLDGLVLPETRHTEVTQYGHLEMIRSLWPETELPPIHKIDEPQSWSHTGEEYYYKQLGRFRDKLREWTGYSVSDRRLLDAIELCNESRRLLMEAQKLRIQGKVSGTEMLTVIGSSWFMDKDEHNMALRLFLREAEDRPAKAAKPLYLDGSPLDNLQLYSLIEECGAMVVDEDNCWGMRSVEELVDTKRFDDPQEALAQRYHYRHPCPYLIYPLTARCEYCTKKLSGTTAKGVVIYADENDAAQHWDYAYKKDMLDQCGLPVLPLLHEEYEVRDREALKKTLSDFIDRL